MYIKNLRGVLLLSTCLCAQTAFAQDGDPVLLDTLRIDSSQAQDLLGNDEITEEEIEERNPTSIADVFNGESSVNASGGAAIAQKVFVNGIEESLLSVTIDGARQNKSAFHHTGNILIDPALLKSVEVSEGIAPADAGPNALAGGLAYTTKDARDFLEEGDEFGGLATVRWDSNGEGLRRSLTLFGQKERFEWLLSGTQHTGDDYEDGDGLVVPGTEPDLTAGIAKFAINGDDGERLSFSASDTKDTGTRAAQAGPGGILFTRPDFAAVVGRPSTFVDALSRRTSYTLTYQDEQPDGNKAPYFQLSYNEQEIDASGVWGLNTSFSGIAQNVWQLDNGNLTAGIDFFDESAEGQGRGPGAFGSSGMEELFNLGFYAQARQDLTERLSVSYGARFDNQRFEGADGSEFKESGLSYNGQLDYVLTPTVNFSAGYSHSWGGYELGEAALINFGTPWDYTGFQTSSSDSVRAGLRYDDGIWGASVAYFYTEVNDYSAVLPTGGARGASYDIVSSGIDSSLSYTGQNGYAKLNYTFADVEMDGAAIGSTAYYLGRPMGHIIALEAGYNISSEWRTGGNMQIALKNNDTATGVVLPGYAVANVFFSYKPEEHPGLELRFDVENIFDETYESRSSDGIDAANVVALNEPGRNFAVTVSRRF